MSGPVKWPADGAPLNYESLAASVRKAVRFAYEMSRRCRDVDRGQAG